MSVVAIKRNSKLKLVMNAGLNEKNKTITKSKTVQHARMEADNEVLFNIAQGFAALQKHSLTNVFKHDEYELLEE